MPSLARCGPAPQTRRETYEAQPLELLNEWGGIALTAILIPPPAAIIIRAAYLYPRCNPYTLWSSGAASDRAQNNLVFDVAAVRRWAIPMRRRPVDQAMFGAVRRESTATV